MKRMIAVAVTIFWKIAYLQRLRKEKTDESYINAYLKAWNLSPAEAFAAADHP
jgi:hypothetical protein